MQTNDRSIHCACVILGHASDQSIETRTSLTFPFKPTIQHARTRGGFNSDGIFLFIWGGGGGGHLNGASLACR